MNALRVHSKDFKVRLSFSVVKMSEESFIWCSDCSNFVEMHDKDHEDHRIFDLLSDEDDGLPLKELKEFASVAVGSFRDDFEKAKMFSNKAKVQKEKLKTHMLKRIEMIVKDLRIALEDDCARLFKEIDNKIQQAEKQAQIVMRATPEKVEAAEELVRCADAFAADRKDSNVQMVKLNYQLLHSYVYGEAANKLPEAEVFIKFPNTLKSKDECRELVTKLIGRVISSKKEAMLQRKSSIDVVNLTDF